MNREAVRRVLDYCETHGSPVQVTWDGKEYTADFKHDNHARDCSTNMIAAGFDVKYNPTIEGISYYARLI